MLHTPSPQLASASPLVPSDNRYAGSGLASVSARQRYGDSSSSWGSRALRFEKKLTASILCNHFYLPSLFHELLSGLHRPVVTTDAHLLVPPSRPCSTAKRSAVSSVKRSAVLQPYAFVGMAYPVESNHDQPARSRVMLVLIGATWSALRIGARPAAPGLTGVT